MTNITDGGPAFPMLLSTDNIKVLLTNDVPPENVARLQAGMSLLSYYRAAAMTGLLASYTTSTPDPEKLALRADSFARAMLAYETQTP